MAIYTMTLQAADGSETTMSMSSESLGPQVAGGLRMTGAEIKAATDAGGPGSVRVRMFDNDAGLPVLSVVEV